MARDGHRQLLSQPPSGCTQVHHLATRRKVVDMELASPINSYVQLIWRCPLYENAYSPESMHNRVSRYPFPDHHPPPLALLPLAVREMTAWLEADPERVAIIHCKAGKVGALNEGNKLRL